MPLTCDKPRVFESSPLLCENALPVQAGSMIFDGAAVGEVLRSGLHRAYVAGDRFVGFAIRQCDNRHGDDGDRRVDVRESGRVVLNVAGVGGLGDRTQAVYAIDDDSFAIGIVEALSAEPIGQIIRVESNGQSLVEFQPFNATPNAAIKPRSYR
jgi:hypothetical protein